MSRYFFISALVMAGGYTWGLADGLSIADSVHAAYELGLNDYGR
ncbi:hypothetical protein [Azotobacter beijerinckii]|nr:hypothetical protein [Azotobacter beijerinckii]